jgi:hypothetical protein
VSARGRLGLARAVVALLATAACRPGEVAPAAPRAATADAPPQSLPGGIADARAHVGFIVDDAGQLAALDLDTGKPVWTSTAATQPLATVTRNDSRLVAALVVDAQAPARPRIAILDAATGALVRTSDPIVLPDWASAARAGGQSFSIRALASTDPLVLEWHATRGWWGGVQPPRDYRGNAARARVALELSSGAVRGVATRPVDLPDALRGLKSAPVAWVFADELWSTAPIVSGAAVAVLDRVFEGVPAGSARPGEVGYEHWAMRRWERTSGRALPTVALLRGRNVITSLTPDGRELVQQDGSALDALPPEQRLYWVYSVETGALLAKIPHDHAAAAEVDAIGRQGFVEVADEHGPQLVAYDLRTGARVWVRALFAPPPLAPPP